MPTRPIRSVPTHSVNPTTLSFTTSIAANGNGVQSRATKWFRKIAAESTCAASGWMGCCATGSAARVVAV